MKSEEPVNRIFNAAPNDLFRELQRNMAGDTALAALRAAAHECQLAAPSFTDEQAAQGLAITDELRAVFLPPASSQPASRLLQLPAELLSIILSRLDTRDLALLAATCRSLCRDAPAPPPPPRQIGPVETELRRRAEARGLDVGSSLPEGATSWVACLLKRDRRDTQMRQAPLAVGSVHAIFVDKGGRLLTSGRDGVGAPLGHTEDPDADPGHQIGSPTLVPSMQDRRIVSVATSQYHCLALGAEGEVYSWGEGAYGALGHGDEGARAVPSMIETLSHIECIAAGPNQTSAAVDEKGRLFTWGRARFYKGEDEYGELDEFRGPGGLDYQPTPKRVDALSQNRVVGIALGLTFALAVTDAGAVFFLGFTGLGHGSLESEVVPRRIDALTQTRRRFVAVAAGDHHALALTEEGDLYGWGDACANGHGDEERAPRRVAALFGERVKLIDARHDASCAVTEKGELFTWSSSGCLFNLGHGVTTSQDTPKRVEGLGGAGIAAVAIGGWHTLAADRDGVVWAFGELSKLFDDLNHNYSSNNSIVVATPTPIPTLRVRALKSP